MQPHAPQARAHHPLPLHTELYEAHRYLDELLGEVSDAIEAGLDKAALVTLWTRFDHALRAHMELEETLLLPALRLVHPLEVGGLQEDHVHLLARLEELDLAVQLHSAGRGQLMAFLAELRAHARKEDGGAYRWADVDLDDAQKAALRRALRGA